MKIILMLGLILSSTTFAQRPSRESTCTPVTIDVSPLNREHPRDQKDIGWCYAVTAADLLSQKLGRVISAANMANNYNHGGLFNRFRAPNHPDRAYGGLGSIAIQRTVQRGGACNEDELSYDNYLALIQNDETYQELRSMRQFWEQTKSVGANTEPDFQSFLCAGHQGLLGELSDVFENLGLSDIVKVMEESTRRDVINQMVSLQCEQRQDPALKAVKVKGILKGRWSKIDEAMNSGKMVGITYRANILMNQADRSFIPDHVSSIIGRRFNSSTGQCEYQIRNSYGSECVSEYDRSLECSHGNIWVPQRSFNRSMLGAYYIE